MGGSLPTLVDVELCLGGPDGGKPLQPQRRVTSSPPQHSRQSRLSFSDFCLVHQAGEHPLMSRVWQHHRIEDGDFLFSFLLKKIEHGYGDVKEDDEKRNLSICQYLKAHEGCLS
jgi:hypothetical protein